MSMLENWLYLLQSFGFNPKQFDQRNLGYIFCSNKKKDLIWRKLKD